MGNVNMIVVYGKNPYQIISIIYSGYTDEKKKGKTTGSLTDTNRIEKQASR